MTIAELYLDKIAWIKLCQLLYFTLFRVSFQVTFCHVVRTPKLENKAAEYKRALLFSQITQIQNSRREGTSKIVRGPAINKKGKKGRGNTQSSVDRNKVKP